MVSSLVFKNIILKKYFSVEYGKNGFYKNIINWVSGENLYENQNCFVLNFGAAVDIPAPQIISNKDQEEISSENWDVQSHCFYVLVNKKLEEEVTRRIQSVSKIVGKRPLVVFIIGAGHDAMELGDSLPRNVVRLFLQ